jgi:TATA-box binding protein (TBP) (component of TFIID and TFIIIB)
MSLNNINLSNNTIINYINVDKYEITDLPDGISISTMCASCKLTSRLNIQNIKNYLQLDKNNILTVKPNNGDIRSLLIIKEKPKRSKKIISTKKSKLDKNNFYNQITIIIRIDEGDTNNIDGVPKINMKLFNNGSIQMSGCKSIKSINIVLTKLVKKLKEVKCVIENNKIIEKPFAEDVDTLSVSNFKIDMINSNYQVKMQVDRQKLYQLLLKKKIKSSYEPCIRACVIIKFIPEIENETQKEVSIFIFQKGNIIITGARAKSHIIASYTYINNILLTHYDEIIKKNEIDEEKLILNVYEQILKEIDIGLLKI